MGLVNSFLRPERVHLLINFFPSDYRHGTGHGVGHFLNVHEGPQGIGMRATLNDTALKKGMTVSNGNFLHPTISNTLADNQQSD